MAPISLVDSKITFLTDELISKLTKLKVSLFYYDWVSEEIKVVT